jgi:biofilm PGA synthesis N-glycosyltransferase PgaC
VKSAGLQYLLVTPAKNEEAFIELTIQSVVKQTVLPVRWLIVSDGSTDKTDEIVRRYAEKHTWIELFRMPERETRHFGGKALGFNAGYARIKHLTHDIVGSLDADISFADDYFEFLLRKFAEDRQLGVAGTPFSETGVTYDYRYSSIEHVSGACQLFRCECLDAIGGYVPVKGGGIDVIAVLSARMAGWNTRTYPEKVCEHHRPMGSANHRNNFNANFKLGQRGYRLGFHPLWQVLRSVYQMTRKPYIIAGTALFLGYFWAMLRRMERPIDRELVKFQQRDQMRRLRGLVGLGSRLGSTSK